MLWNRSKISPIFLLDNIKAISKYPLKYNKLFSIVFIIYFVAFKLKNLVFTFFAIEHYKIFIKTRKKYIK